jgi:hypothetical protein
MIKQYIVRLTDEERDQLGHLIRAGKGAARKLTHARILLKADSRKGGPGWSHARIAESLDVGRPGAARSAVDTHSGLESIRAFCNWCVKAMRLPANPLGMLAMANTQPDIRRKRRALTESELQHLVSPATRSFTCRKISSGSCGRT